MSIIRMSPEFISTIETGAVVRVVRGGVPFGAKVTRVWVEHRALEGAVYTIYVEVDDGIADERVIVFERVEADAPR